MLSDLFESQIGIIILSVIWGLGLSTIFFESCEGTGCKVYDYVVPHPDTIKDYYYNYGTNKCYQYYPVISECKN